MALPDYTFCKPLHALQGVVMWHYHGFQNLHQRSNLPPPQSVVPPGNNLLCVWLWNYICPPRLVRTPDPSGCARTRRVWGPWPCAKDTRRDVDSWLVENGFTLLRSKCFPRHSTLFEANCPPHKGSTSGLLHGGTQCTVNSDPGHLTSESVRGAMVLTSRFRAEGWDSGAETRLTLLSSKRSVLPSKFRKPYHPQLTVPSKAFKFVLLFQAMVSLSLCVCELLVFPCSVASVIHESAV